MQSQNTVGSGPIESNQLISNNAITQIEAIDNVSIKYCEEEGAVHVFLNDDQAERKLIAKIIDVDNEESLRKVSCNDPEVFYIAMVRSREHSFLSQSESMTLPVAKRQIHEKLGDVRSLSVFRNHHFPPVKNETDQCEPQIEAIDPALFGVRPVSGRDGQVELYAKGEIAAGTAIAYMGKDVMAGGRKASEDNTYTFMNCAASSRRRKPKQHEITPDVRGIVVHKICVFLENEFPGGPSRQYCSYKAYKAGNNLLQLVQHNTTLYDKRLMNDYHSLAVYADSCCTDHPSENCQSLSVRWDKSVYKGRTYRPGIVFIITKNISPGTPLHVSYGKELDNQIQGSVLNNDGVVVTHLVPCLASDSEPESDLDERRLKKPKTESAGSSGFELQRRSAVSGLTPQNHLYGSMCPIVSSLGTAHTATATATVPTATVATATATVATATAVAATAAFATATAIPAVPAFRARPAMYQPQVAPRAAPSAQAATVVPASPLPDMTQKKFKYYFRKRSQDLVTATDMGQYCIHLNSAFLMVRFFFQPKYRQVTGNYSMEVDGCRNKIFLWLLLNISSTVGRFSLHEPQPSQAGSGRGLKELVHQCIGACFTRCIENKVIDFYDHIDGGHVWLSICIGINNCLRASGERVATNTAVRERVEGWGYYLYAVLIRLHDRAVKCAQDQGKNDAMSEYVSLFTDKSVVGRKGCATIPEEKVGAIVSFKNGWGDSDPMILVDEIKCREAAWKQDLLGGPS